MTELDRQINLRLMEEMGFEEGPKKRIIDQDTQTQFRLKGKDIVTPGAISGKQAIEFDPINNSRMMGYLFGEFVNKLEEEESIPPVASFYTISEQDKVKAVVMFDNQDKLESKPYTNDTVAYAELTLRLNGEEDVDLDEYDIDRRKPMTMVQAPAPKKRSKK